MNLLAVGKGRRAKFELHLKIYDLNNVPLVSGQSFVKWNLSHSVHGEHRGRTNKCSIQNHKVDYAYSKVVTSVRIPIDKNNHLTECAFDFEVVQEFAVTEKITLGTIRLNLSEYVEESEAINKDGTYPGRGRSSSVNVSPSSAPVSNPLHHECQDGVVRRYLMQESKVNSTLKIGILMVQKDGDRNFTAPPLRTAPVFGGIAGFAAGEAGEEEMSSVPNIQKPREMAEIHDLYRRTLSASWYRLPGELPADECIEDIFSGGDGWRTKPDSGANTTDSDSTSDDTDSPVSAGHHGTLRPRDFRRGLINFHSGHSHLPNLSHQAAQQTSLHPQSQQRHQHHHHHHHTHHGHRRTHSGSSDKSVSTVTGGKSPGSYKGSPRIARDSGGGLRDTDSMSARSRGSSFVSMTPTTGSESSVSLARGWREIDEQEAREDFVAWKLPGSSARVQ